MQSHEKSSSFKITVKFHLKINHNVTLSTENSTFSPNNVKNIIENYIDYVCFWRWWNFLTLQRGERTDKPKKLVSGNAEPVQK